MAQPALRVHRARQQVVEGAVRFQVGAMRVERLVVQAQAGVFPGRAAERALRRERRCAGAALGDAGEAELLVLLPVPVGRDAEQLAEAPLALGALGEVVVDDTRHQRAAGRAAGDQQRVQREQHRQRRRAGRCGHAPAGLQGGHAGHRQQREAGSHQAVAQPGYRREQTHHQAEETQPRLAQAVVEQDAGRHAQRHRAECNGQQAEVRACPRRAPAAHPQQGAQGGVGQEGQQEGCLRGAVDGGGQQRECSGRRDRRECSRSEQRTADQAAHGIGRFQQRQAGALAHPVGPGGPARGVGDGRRCYDEGATAAIRASCNFCMSIGLVRKPSMPLARASSRSEVSAAAVSAMMGRCRLCGRARSARVAS